MKFALAQVNPTVGDISGNVQKIAQTIAEHSNNVDVLVFPEMVLTGYPPQDLLFDYLNQDHDLEKLRSLVFL